MGPLAALTPAAIGATATGAIVGLVFSAIPGLTFSTALALMMPFTFGLDTVPAIGMLLGIYSGGMTGGCARVRGGLSDLCFHGNKDPEETGYSALMLFFRITSPQRS